MLTHTVITKKVWLAYFSITSKYYVSPVYLYILVSLRKLSHSKSLLEVRRWLFHRWPWSSDVTKELHIVEKQTGKKPTGGLGRKAARNPMLQIFLSPQVLSRRWYASHSLVFGHEFDTHYKAMIADQTRFSQALLGRVFAHCKGSSSLLQPIIRKRYDWQSFFF